MCLERGYIAVITYKTLQMHNCFTMSVNYQKLAKRISPSGWSEGGFDLPG